MDIEITVIVMLAVLGAGLFLYFKANYEDQPEPKKPEPLEKEEQARMQLKQSIKESEIDNVPYQVRIIGQREFSQNYSGFDPFLNLYLKIVGASVDQVQFSPLISDLYERYIETKIGLYETRANIQGIGEQDIYVLVVNKPEPEPRTDDTRKVRDIISRENKIDFGEQHFTTHGMLPEDLKREYFTPSGQSLGFIGDVGAGKILTLQGREDVVITGGIFSNPDVAFPYEKDFGRRHHDVSENTFLHVEKCRNISLIGQSFTGPNTKLREETGFPLFHSRYEFEHALDISESENMLIRNWKASNVFGDFVYFRKGAFKNRNISILDSEVHFNARQVIGFGDGENILIQNVRGTLGGRGGVDIEPPKHGYEVKNLIVRGCYFKVWLLPAPMGGLGVAENILFENNEWTTTAPNTYMLADRVNSFRRNIIFRGNKRLSGYGSDDAVIVAEGVEGLLVENEYAYLKPTRSLEAVLLNYCTNVVIRHNDFPNAKYIVLRDTPAEEVKVYGNTQDLQFKIYEFDMPFKPAPDLKDFAHYGRGDWEQWLLAREEWMQYNAKRNSRATLKYVPVEEYDVEKYGEPDVPKDPEFTPYMGE